jgi:GNAT superfamily N-acetyltransferase
MTTDPRSRVRAAGRHDVPHLVDLRIRYLGEMAKLEPRFSLLPDARQKTEHSLPVWLGQEERIVLVALGDDGAKETPLVGYATGQVSVWPPVFRTQHVGEVSEAYVVPEERGKGLGRALLTRLMDVLVSRGAKVLRAPVAAKDEASVGRFRAMGYRTLQVVLQRSLEEV